MIIRDVIFRQALSEKSRILQFWKKEIISDDNQKNKFWGCLQGFRVCSYAP